jgi:subtilase family serine protease
MARSFLTGAAFGFALLTAPQFALATVQTGFVGVPAATQTVNFNVYLPLRNEAQLEQLVQLQGDRKSPLYHHFLSVAQFRANYAPSPQSAARAVAALRARGLAVIGQSSQSIRVSGAAATIEKALGTRLGVVRGTQGAVRIARMTALSVPTELAALGATVTGLEPRIHLHVYSRRVPLNRYSAVGGYWFDDLKQAYTYPSDRAFDGSGANIGILTASDVLDSDTLAAFSHERYTAISGKTPREIKRVALGGGGGLAGPNAPNFIEASIDVQTSQGSAPGAQVYLYNIPDLNDSSVIAGYVQIIEDNKVDVVSSSFGGFELDYTAPYENGVDQTYILKIEHDLFLQGNAQGITFVASSGDEAGLPTVAASYFSGDPNTHFLPGADTPASDPNVTAVGGTNLVTATPPSPQPTPPVLRSRYVRESEFADPLSPYDPYGAGVNVSGGYFGSGSGTSAFFKKPWYQYLVDTGAGRRATPDISMQMGGCPFGTISCSSDDSFGYYFVGGAEGGYIGTSLSSPEFAGLLAVKIGATHQRLGNVNGYIYELAQANDALPPNFPTKFYHQGSPGYNGVVNVPAGKRGYNPIIGVGTPFTQNFLGVPQVPLAGDPQTLSNP